MNLTTQLASKFSELLREELTADEIQQVIELNANAENKSACASHDFCDANMVMSEAFTSVIGHDVDVNNDSDVTLWNNAWSEAKAANFTF